ncbi:MAG: hypothetical protein NT154_26455 [Verrucomicrobia bacterium]|nr:hypothetical protein [Verrucomicrobiota bacterium]
MSATVKLCGGLEKVLSAYQGSSDARKKQIHDLWAAAGREKGT